MLASNYPAFLVSLTRRSRLLRLTLLLSAAASPGCGSDEENEPGKAGLGGACKGADAGGCELGLSCEPRADSDERVCGKPLMVAGTLTDALTTDPVASALVFVMDQTGAPVAQAKTNSDGEYEALVSTARNADGSIVKDASWTMAASAQAYQPFPYGVRTPVPVTVNQVESAGDHLMLSAENTDVVLVPLKDADDLVMVRGAVDASASGALVVAETETTSPAPFGIVGPDGAFTIFNVPKGAVSLRVYSKGLHVEPKSLTVDGDVEDVSLTLDDSKLVNVSGSINIVNAPGGSLSSVVLVPQSVFDPIAEKGPVPLGLRVPDAPSAPDVAGAFEFEDVSPGTYVVLAAFENDDLVRDPDSNIGGTALQTVEVGTTAVEVDESFKVTAALAVESPGASGVEEVSEPLTFVWADDSSEDQYHVVVRSALGEVVWEVADVPGVSGEETVSLDYAGPELTPGMFYQFQATSIRDTKDGLIPISRTEDLRGAFRVK
jgi:hypothetical protein